MNNRSTRRQMLRSAVGAALLSPVVVSLAPGVARARGSWCANKTEMKYAGEWRMHGAEHEGRYAQMFEDRPTMSEPIETGGIRQKPIGNSGSSDSAIPYTYKWRENKHRDRIRRIQERALWNQSTSR